MSEIGERGVSIGHGKADRLLTDDVIGQLVWWTESSRYVGKVYGVRARAKCFCPVSLARAVYSRASILLLDDVLSAGAWTV